jgi:hypothetical protein
VVVLLMVVEEEAVHLLLELLDLEVLVEMVAQV